MKPERRKLLKAQDRAYKIALYTHNLEACGFSLDNPPPTTHVLFNQYQLVRANARRVRKTKAFKEWVADTSKMDLNLNSPMEYGGDTRWSRTCD